MAEIKAKWVDNLQFIAIDAENHSLVMDGSPKAGGQGTGFRPAQLLLVGLAGCTGMDVISVLRKKRQEVTSLELVVSGEQASEPPWAYKNISVEYIIKGKNIDEAAVKRAIELSETKYCSVKATLEERVNVSSSYRIENEP